MRVLIFGNCAPLIGGIETFVANEAEALIDRGHAVGVISDGTALRCFDVGRFPVWSVPMGQPLHDTDPRAIFDSIMAIRATVDAFAPDVIHFHAAGPELLAADRALARCKVPIVLTVHNHAFAKPTVVTSRMMARAAAVTAVSDFIACHIFQASGNKPQHVVEAIANCVPPGTPPTPPPDARSILAIGRLVDKKGMDTLVEAFALVRANCADARLTIAGDGPELENLRAQASQSGIADAIAFPGWVTQSAIRATLDAASMVVMPSRWEEPFGLVAIEAARAGRPIIATRAGALASIVQDGVSGLLVPVDDPAAMADAINRLLADPVMARRLGRQARDELDRRFDFGKMIDRYVARLTGVAERVTSPVALD